MGNDLRLPVIGKETLHRRIGKTGVHQTDYARIFRPPDQPSRSLDIFDQSRLCIGYHLPPSRAFRFVKIFRQKVSLQARWRQAQTDKNDSTQAHVTEVDAFTKQAAADNEQQSVGCRRKTTKQIIGPCRIEPTLLDKHWNQRVPLCKRLRCEIKIRIRGQRYEIASTPGAQQPVK